MLKNIRKECQTVIRMLYNKRIGRLEWIYNYEARFHSVFEIFTWPFFYRKLQGEIKIIHYMGAGKPWKPKFFGKYLREYYRYAIHTAYQDEIERNMRYRLANMVRFLWDKLIWRRINDKWKGLINFYESIGLWNRRVL